MKEPFYERQFIKDIISTNTQRIEEQPLFEPFEIENILIGKFFYDDTFHEKEIPIDFTRANGKRYSFVTGDYIYNRDDNSADPYVAIGYYDENGRRIVESARETEANEMNAILFSMQDKDIQADLFRRMKEVRAERDNKTTQRYRFNNLFKSNVLAFNSDVDVDGNIFRLPEGQYMGSVLKKTVEDALAGGMEKDQVKAFAAKHKEIIETRYYLIESQKKLAEEAIAFVSGEAKQQAPAQQHDTFQDKCRRAMASRKINSVGELRDGWALVQAPNGKYNYADAEGKFMTKNWLDSASEFKDGKATVTRGGTVATINKEGICIAAKAEKTLHK